MTTATITRTSKETVITVTILPEGGKYDISTGIGFFDHMLTALTVHSGIPMVIHAVGDTHVDAHHTVEDTGIVLGQALAKALGDKSGIKRYGSAYIPMDESLAFCCMDICNRPFLVYNAEYTNAMIGAYDTCLTEEFLRAFAFNAGITLHANVMYGKNDHHKTEALFKAVAHALRIAAAPTGDGEVFSTKGMLG
ncbi:MAG: imidazoleglycerol-phosphate dehydratase HisB [Oscillospiraceae bacterium]|nr:imidazoleglycerol-phosphate dehydratase HisB [Oscillospiraceae bacterium]MBR1898855.1 imidazoleglycerol-phosphate dehydratase HisB [Oscillospiraceae bacterium]